MGSKAEFSVAGLLLAIFILVIFLLGLFYLFIYGPWWILAAVVFLAVLLILAFLIC